MAGKRRREDDPVIPVSQTGRKRCRKDEYASSSTDGDSVFSEVVANSTCDTDSSSVDEGQQENHGDLADFFADNDDENTHPPDYYLKLLSSLKDHEYKGTKYALKSLALLDRVEENWTRCVKSVGTFRLSRLMWFFRFCAYIKQDPIQLYKTLTVQVCHTFLEWVLNQKRGKDGRLLKGIKVQSSFHTFWKVFRLVYERANSQKIPDDIQVKIGPVSTPYKVII